MRRLPAGVGFAIAAAALFGASTPCAKLLLQDAPPLLLAGLLYAGSGLGLSVVRLFLPSSARAARLRAAELPWLAGAVLSGGILAPVLLMSGLRATPASAASLLLNLEGVFTALIAWFVFHENFDRRIALGFALIVAGGLILSWPRGGEPTAAPALGALAIAGACLCWAVDNNFTQRVSAGDPYRLAAIKGGVAALVNVSLALFGGARWPAVGQICAALAVGFVGYGVSLVLFVLALRHLGTARTGAYFSLAPFFGAALALVLLRETASASLGVAGTLMAIGAWLHMTEHHDHEHRHERVEHLHSHVHDEHHQHDHAAGVSRGEPHDHPHVHEPMTHRHPHYPDVHHRHRHD